MQVESIEAATAVRQLASPGVDLPMFGPSDLTLNLRAHPNHALQTVDDCVRYVARELEGSDTRPCMRVPAGAERAKYRDKGVTILLEYGVR